jgi:hypothetical protein
LWRELRLVDEGITIFLIVRTWGVAVLRPYKSGLSSREILNRSGAAFALLGQH